MMRSFILLAGLFLFTITQSIAQREANIWYFGANAGLDFNSGAPVPLTNGQVNTAEGCSAISDSAGNLLFYTDGLWVYNRNHTSMPNGFWSPGQQHVQPERAHHPPARLLHDLLHLHRRRR